MKTRSLRSFKDLGIFCKVLNVICFSSVKGKVTPKIKRCRCHLPKGDGKILSTKNKVTKGQEPQIKPVFDAAMMGLSVRAPP